MVVRLELSHEMEARLLEQVMESGEPLECYVIEAIRERLNREAMADSSEELSGRNRSVDEWLNRFQAWMSSRAADC